MTNLHLQKNQGKTLQCTELALTCPLARGNIGFASALHVHTCVLRAFNSYYVDHHFTFLAA